MSGISINVHYVISVRQETIVYPTFTATTLHIKTADGETSTLSLFNDPSIRPKDIEWSKT